jgi:hypothetical protein
MGTVGNLITQVRYQLDELNEASVSDEQDIIPSLSRGHDYACSLLARFYEAPLIVSKNITTTSSIDYPIPPDAFEQRIEHVELLQNQDYYRHLTSVDFRQSTYLEGIAGGAHPTHWAIIGPNLRLLPRPAAGLTVRVWYSKDPGSLVKEQGRIRQTPTTDQAYLILDEVGPDISEDTLSYSSFFNVVDAATGRVKCTLQVGYVENSRIYFKTNPTYSEVEGRAVSSTLNDLGITAGDYVCSYSGICVPVLQKPLSNFLIQFAVAEITRSLGGDAPTEEAVLKKFEEQVKKTWAGRNKTLRVQRTNSFWTSPNNVTRRYPR